MNVRFLTGLLAAASLYAAPAVYTIDTAHSGAHFSVRHMMVSNVKGQFSGVKGTVEFDPANLASAKVDASVDVTTIDTRQEKRDSHLKSADFFDVAKHPTIRFVSKRAMPAAPGKLKLLGDLTLRGVTREVTLDVDGPAPELKEASGTVRTGASATTTISRKDFGMTWNRAIEAGGVAVSDEVQITIDVELIRKQ